MRTRWRLGALSLGLALAACSSNGTGPTTTDSALNQDVATVTADVAAQDVELMRGPGGLMGLRLPADPTRWECTSHQWGPVTINRTCTFVDANGVEQQAYDRQTTDTVRLHADVSGAIDRGHWSGSVERTRDLTASGLAGDETSVTWNGTGSGQVTRVRELQDSTVKQFDLSQSFTVTDLVIPVPRTDTSWPLSGTITMSATVTITGGPRDGTVKQCDVTITFDGTNLATVTVNGETFQFDLSNRHRAERRQRP